MSTLEPPGNPKGWGDPAPIAMIVLLMVFFGAWIDQLDQPLSVQQCQEILRRDAQQNP
jgi:hypothetical protein